MIAPEVGRLYDLTFAANPGASLRVRVLGADEELARTPCGARRFPVVVVSGTLAVEAKKQGRAIVLGPGDVVGIPAFVATWTPAFGGAR